jgi:hypothetical protein
MELRGLGEGEVESATGPRLPAPFCPFGGRARVELGWWRTPVPSSVSLRGVLSTFAFTAAPGQEREASQETERWKGGSGGEEGWSVMAM